MGVSYSLAKARRDIAAHTPRWFFAALFSEGPSRRVRCSLGGRASQSI
jgi:hypothetical protein